MGLLNFTPAASGTALPQGDAMNPNVEMFINRYLSTADPETQAYARQYPNTYFGSMGTPGWKPEYAQMPTGPTPGSQFKPGMPGAQMPSPAAPAAPPMQGMAPWQPNPALSMPQGLLMGGAPQMAQRAPLQQMQRGAKAPDFTSGLLGLMPMLMKAQGGK